MKQDANKRWEYDREEFMAMSETEQDNLMFWLAEKLNDFGDSAREIYALAEWMCRTI